MDIKATDPSIRVLRASGMPFPDEGFVTTYRSEVPNLLSIGHELARRMDGAYDPKDLTDAIEMFGKARLFVSTYVTV